MCLKHGHHKQFHFVILLLKKSFIIMHFIAGSFGHVLHGSNVEDMCGFLLMFSVRKKIT